MLLQYCDQNKASGLHYLCLAVITLAACLSMDWVQNPVSDVCIKLHYSIYRNQFPHTVHLILCSSSLCRLSISGFDKNTNKKVSGARSFCCSAPTLWNRLPDNAPPPSPFPHLPPLIITPALYPPPPFSIVLFAKRSKHVVSHMESECTLQESGHWCWQKFW